MLRNIVVFLSKWLDISVKYRLGVKWQGLVLIRQAGSLFVQPMNLRYAPVNKGLFNNLKQCCGMIVFA